MTFSFKNTELFRYYISKSVTENIDRVIEQNNSQYSMIAGSIFSGSFSILGTIVSMVYSTYEIVFSKSIKNDEMYVYDLFGEIVLYVVIFCILFIIGLYLYKLLSYIKRLLINVYGREKRLSQDEIKKIKNDFDHIVCDNILISYEFKEQYNNPKSRELKIYYFYEMIYYLQDAVLKTKKIFMNAEDCINTPNISGNIELYRILNILEMMKIISKYAEEEQEYIDIEERYMPMLKNQIRNISSNIDSLWEDLKKFYEKYWGMDLEDQIVKNK